MRRRAFIAMLGTALIGSGAALGQRTRIPTVALLSVGSEPSDSALRAAAFREGLRDTGWIEGQSVELDYHYAGGDRQRLPALAAAIVAKHVAAIVAFDSDSTQAALQATNVIPIVIAASADPVGRGFASSLARPGGNVTGISLMMRDLVPKQLEVLKEGVGRLSRVAVLQVSTPWHDDMVADLVAAGQTLGVDVRSIAIEAGEDPAKGFAAMAASGSQAILVLPHPSLDEMRSRLAELALLHQMASMGPIRSAAVAGFLFSYGPSLPAMHRRAATYVARILRGESPSRLPVEQPSQFELIVNQSSAWALGLTLPPALLVRADEVIE